MTSFNSITVNLALVALVVLVVYGGRATAEPENDPQAAEHCKKYNKYVGPLSFYSNNYCQLNCYWNPDMFEHPINEGLRCPTADSKNFICHSGQCGAKGYFQLTIQSAEVTKNISAFATACLLNTTIKEHLLPLADRSQCIDCITDVTDGDLTWDTQCYQFSNRCYTSQSTVVLEVYQDVGSVGNQFVGGAVVPTVEITKHKSGKFELNTPLVGGNLNGTIKTELQFTARGSR